MALIFQTPAADSDGFVELVGVGVVKPDHPIQVADAAAVLPELQAGGSPLTGAALEEAAEAFAAVHRLEVADVSAEATDSVAALKARIGDASDEDREAVKAEIRAAEEAREKPRTTVLAATEPAEPAELETTEPDDPADDQKE